MFTRDDIDQHAARILSKLARRRAQSLRCQSRRAARRAKATAQFLTFAFEA